MSRFVSSASANRAEVVSIQYVRAAAAIIVVIWHTGWSRSFVGQSGVDLFFVVSGFVMMLVSGREDSPARFLLARVLRIAPLYFAMTIVVAAMTKPAGWQLGTSLLFLPADRFPVVIQGWSLNLEMAYYVLFALSLLLPGRWRLVALAVEFAVLCGPLALLARPDSMLEAWTSPLALEFLAGAGLHAMWRRDWLPVGAAAWSMGAAALVVLGATHFAGGGLVGWTRVAFWGLPALAIVAAGLGIERSGQLPRVPTLTALGDSSYALYLTHVVVLGLIAPVLTPLWAPVALPLALIATCTAGYAVHLAFERPLHRWTKGLLTWRAPSSGRPRPA